MTTFEAVSVLFGSLGLLGGAIGFFRSVVADRRSAAAEAEAADARSDAASALEKSADATERIAAAVEILARRRGVTPNTLLAEALDPAWEALREPREVLWAVEKRTPANSFRLRNVGSIPARAVTIDSADHAALLADEEHPELQPGAATVFNTLPRLALTEIEVHWQDDSATENRHATVTLP